jgi:hypothetical protein
MPRPAIRPLAVAAALAALPGLAHASDAPDFGWILLAALVYAVALVLHVAGCALASLRTRSWRPWLALPLSIVFTAVLATLVGMIRAPEVLGMPTHWLLFPLPLVAIPLALWVYRDLVRERAPAAPH